MADFVGLMLGPYQITQELGHGGMANVYLAAQPSVGRQVTIKVLPSQFLQDRTFLERFTREVRLIAQLQHPRILPIYDFGEQDGVPYIVMAYMTGGTLVDLIKDSYGGMDFDEIALLAIGAEAGLITLYDPATGESISEWQAHDGLVTQLTWLDGSVLVSSGVDGKLVFWQ